MASNSELRGAVLTKYYDARTSDRMVSAGSLSDDLIDFDTVFRMSEQLHQYGLIEWKAVRGLESKGGASGKITALGVML